MTRILTKAKTLWEILRTGQLSVALSEVCRWLWSDTVAFGLARDLTRPFEAPEALLPISVRPLESSDELDLSSEEGREPGASSDRYTYELKNRLAFLRKRIQTCYVAVTEANEPCYLQWLIGPESNAEIQQHFQGFFPKLASSERLLEYAFTVRRFQGQRVMAAAMARIAEQGVRSGATRAITFVDADNVPALKGCRRAGFQPYVRRIASWRFLRRTVRFEPLNADAPATEPHAAPRDAVRLKSPLLHRRQVVVAAKRSVRDEPSEILR